MGLSTQTSEAPDLSAAATIVSAGDVLLRSETGRWRVLGWSGSTPRKVKRLPAGGGYDKSLVLRICHAYEYTHDMDIRGQRASSWSVTCNLKTISRHRVDECIDAARSLGWGVEGQLERGDEEGTEHYQLLVKTPQVRFSAVKKVFPTAHIEIARNVAALRQYVHKEETRVEELKSVEISFLTYPMVRKKFFEWLCADGLPAPATYDQRLELWDRFIGLSIEEGMECDMIGMNPQHRGCIAKYWHHYINRQTIVDRQTDRQTDDRRQTDRQTDSENISLPTIV